MIKNKIDILALQEICWQGQGRIDKQAYTIIYSGSENRTGQLGTGFMITKLMRASLLEFEAVNDRICRIRLKGRYRNIMIISTHAPIEEKEEYEKGEFYDRLEEICNKVQKYDILIIMGDFNAKIGKEQYLMKVAGKYTIHNKTSENGNLLAQFATRNRLFINSTSFQHKKIHMGTWKIPGTSEVIQIDHVLVSLRHSSSVIDVRSCRAPICDSDHYLVRVKVRERNTMLQKVSRMDRKKWDVEKLSNGPGNQTRKEYQQMLQTKLRRGNMGEEEEDGELDVDEQWKKIEQAIKEAAEETNTRTKTNEKRKLV
jgi:endonuclease/exonuclease/phosphatase family metal-dependent hydrolase